MPDDTRTNKIFRNLAVDIAFHVLQNNEDGIYVMQFSPDRYDLDTVCSIFHAISDVLSSKKLVAIPDGIGIQLLSKEQAKEIADELLKYTGE